MSVKATVKKIMEHPDQSEILSKLLIQIDPKEVFEWLESKYSNVNEKKFVISEKSLKDFADNYLDIYSMVQEDLAKVKSSSEDDLNLTIQNSPAYRDILLKTAGQELDIRDSLKNLARAIETRMGQVFDVIQEDPSSINTRVDNVLIKYAEVFGNLLEKYYKFTEAPENNITQNNITLNIVDKQISVVHDTVRETMAQMDLETSMRFMELYSNNIAKMKMAEKDEVQTPASRMIEAQILSEEISKKLEE